MLFVPHWCEIFAKNVICSFFGHIFHQFCMLFSLATTPGCFQDGKCLIKPCFTPQREDHPFRSWYQSLLVLLSTLLMCYSKTLRLARIVFAASISIIFLNQSIFIRMYMILRALVIFLFIFCRVTKVLITFSSHILIAISYH